MEHPAVNVAAPATPPENREGLTVWSQSYWIVG